MTTTMRHLTKEVKKGAMETILRIGLVPVTMRMATENGIVRAAL